jgi:hypothetical protein
MKNKLTAFTIIGFFFIFCIVYRILIMKFIHQSIFFKITPLYIIFYIILVLFADNYYPLYKIFKTTWTSPIMELRWRKFDQLYGSIFLMNEKKARYTSRTGGHI